MPSPFSFALNTSTIRCGGEHSLPELFDVTARAGYAGIEPWVREIDAYVESAGSLPDLASRAADSGLRVINLIGFFEWAVDDDAQRRAGFEEARRNFELAEGLHCPYVAAPPFGLTDATGVDLLPVAERYAELMDLARDFGVVPLLEYWGHSKTLCRLGEALLVAAECGRPEARILADVFHTYKGTGHFEGFSLLNGQRLGLLHINDYPSSPPRPEIRDSARIYPGDGIAPLTDILRILSASGFTGMLSLELFNEEYWAQTPIDVAVTGMRKLEAITLVD